MEQKSPTGRDTVMKQVDHLDAEGTRLRALSTYQILDTLPEQGFDDVAALAAEICGTPFAVVNFIGDGRQFFKAEVGLGVRETPLESSFCRDTAARFCLTWSEQGGPPILNQPARRGFGSRLIERSFAAEVGGEVKLTYAPTGVVCRLEAALSAMQEQRSELAA